MNVSKFERFFRVASGLDVDKTDRKRCSDFVHRKDYDLLLMSQPTVGVWWTERRARAGFKIVDPHLKNPQTQHWETTFRLFDLLL
jgi:hypothetical protein